MRFSFLLETEQASDQRGFSLMEILVAMVLVCLLSATIIQASEYVRTGMRQNQLASSRDQLVVSFRQRAVTIKALQTSLSKPENIFFHNCVCGGGAACISNQTNPLSLYEPLATNNLNPSFYDSAGSPCLKESPSCYIQVTTSYLAQCLPALPSANPVPPANCNTPAEFVMVVYKVEQNPSTLSQGSFFKTIQGGVYTAVSDITPPGSGVCP